MMLFNINVREIRAPYWPARDIRVIERVRQILDTINGCSYCFVMFGEFNFHRFYSLLNSWIDLVRRRSHGPGWLVGIQNNGRANNPAEQSSAQSREHNDRPERSHRTIMSIAI